MPIEPGVRSAIRRAIKAKRVRYLSDIPGFNGLPLMTQQIFLHERLTSPTNAEALRSIGMHVDAYNKWRESKTFRAVMDIVVDRAYHIESRNIVLMLDRTVDKLGFLLEKATGSQEDERLHGMYLKTIKELKALIKEDGTGQSRGGRGRKGFDAIPSEELAPMPRFGSNGQMIVDDVVEDGDDDGTGASA